MLSAKRIHDPSWKISSLYLSNGISVRLIAPPKKISATCVPKFIVIAWLILSGVSSYGVCYFMPHNIERASIFLVILTIQCKQLFFLQAYTSINYFIITKNIIPSKIFSWIFFSLIFKKELTAFSILFPIFLISFNWVLCDQFWLSSKFFIWISCCY